MDTYTVQKSFMRRPADHVSDWHLIDASEHVLGRMAVRIARILMGKHKPTYTPHVDTGDFVVVTNAEKVLVTGNKREQKLYRYHTGYIGGLRAHNLEWMTEHKPDQVIRLAVRRMLPKNKLGRKMLKKLKIYRGSEHPHGAQNPKPLDLK